MGTCDMCKNVDILEPNPRNENIMTGKTEWVEGGINQVCSKCAIEICNDWNEEMNNNESHNI